MINIVLFKKNLLHINIEKQTVGQIDDYRQIETNIDRKTAEQKKQIDKSYRLFENCRDVKNMTNKLILNYQIAEIF